MYRSVEALSESLDGVFSTIRVGRVQAAVFVGANAAVQLAVTVVLVVQR